MMQQIGAEVEQVLLGRILASGRFILFLGLVDVAGGFLYVSQEVVQLAPILRDNISAAACVHRPAFFVSRWASARS